MVFWPNLIRCFETLDKSSMCKFYSIRHLIFYRNFSVRSDPDLGNFYPDLDLSYLYPDPDLGNLYLDPNLGNLYPDPDLGNLYPNPQP